MRDVRWEMWANTTFSPDRHKTCFLCVTITQVTFQVETDKWGKQQVCAQCVTIYQNN